ncbi:MAG: metallophosphoesterase [Acidobacteriota bacterium]
MSKRARIIAVAAISVPILLTAWAFVVEPGRLVVREISLPLPAWTSRLKVAVVADLHIGAPHVGPDKLRTIVAEVNDQHPDIVVLLGDFVIGGPNGGEGVPGGTMITAARIAVELQQLNPPLGVYAVLGNHDWWYGAKNVYDSLTNVGIQVLENEAVRIEHKTGAFWLGGIADLWSSNPDIEATLEQTTAGEPVLLITHNPDIFPDVPARVSLTMAAHTHGGQVQLPFIGALVKTSEHGYNQGHFVENGRHLFVTSGIGTSIYPVRFGVPPEIVILNLEPMRP